MRKGVWENQISILLILACLLLLKSGAQAITTDDIFNYNQTASSEWVNWCPSFWTAQESVSAVTQEIVASTNSMEEIPLFVHDWICKNIYYDWDAFESGTYYELAADEVLQSGKGVCESIANLVQAILLESGIPCIKVWGVAINADSSWENIDISPDRINHTWNEFYMDGHWITMDCTMDMANSYSQGEYIYRPWSYEYFDPDEDFFARTHLRLSRGDTFPENIPSDWAMGEVCTLVDTTAVPLALLSNYHAPITEADMLMLLGIDGGTDAPISRGQTAVLLASLLGFNSSGSTPYIDLGNCNEDMQSAIKALYQKGVMVGTSDDTFSPNTYLTRQEALIIKARLSREGFSCI